MYKERAYRRLPGSDDLVSFEIKEKQTDLYILAARDLSSQARESVLVCRAQIEDYIAKNPEFYTALTPINIAEGAGEIVRAMAEAAGKAGVGPMAAIAGAVSEFVGRDLLAFSDQVIVENGGDIFLKTSRKRVIGVHAGEASPFTGKIAIEIAPSEEGLGVCTSSGTVSHSLSFGNADAALIISANAALADAVATKAGNAVKSIYDIEKGIDLARSVAGVRGVLIMIGDKMGSWGEIKLV
ncbi:MAG: UPF0280 family protein [Candidatus Omnitrophota bacterium]|nr:UPF0280 family protein [Candidatus Omnitrophota bacterium]